MDDQILDPSVRAQLPQNIATPPEPDRPWYKNLKIISSLVIGVLLIAAIGWYFLWGKTAGPNPVSTNVVLLIKGPDTVSSDTEAEFHIIYRNGENADMTKVHLDMIYPSNFQFKSSTPNSKSASGGSFDLPMVKEGKDGEVIVRGKLSGATGEQKTIKARLSYVLTNFNSQFAVEQTFNTAITAPNLTFDITGPAEVPIGQDSDFTVNYKNVSSQQYDNIAVSLTYPDGFHFSASSVPPTKGNNYWVLGKLPVGASGSIGIKGSFTGLSLDTPLLTGQLGTVINNNFAPQINSSASFVLKAAPITVSIQSNPSDVVNLGDSISYTINYENSGSIGLTNLIVTDVIDSNLVDTSKLSISDGVITGTTITWKSATNSNLSLLTPGGHGQITFNVPLKPALPTTVKEQVVKSMVTIASSEVTTPIHAADSQVKIAGKFALDVSAAVVSGSIPMKVGKQTTIAVTMLVSTGSNDVNSGQVTASIPLPSSDWNNVIVPDSEKSRLFYDSNSGKLRWELGNVPAFTGKTSPAIKATFQLVLNPGASDQGQVITLLNDISSSAIDNFTNQQYQQSIQPSQLTTADVDGLDQNPSVE